MARFLTYLAALVLPCLLATPALPQSRGLTVELRTAPEANAPVAAQVELYDNSYALVIGNDAYGNGWPRLSNAVADASEIATALSEHGFEVTLKVNLDGVALRDALREFFAIKGNDPEARLLLWYAGHGHSLKGEGFLVPVDAPAPSEPEFKIRALQMRDFGSLMRLAEAKHVLAIFDSCFSGTIFTTRAGAVPAAITQVTTRPARQFMTSGDAEQQVSDDGTFRRLFLQALAGESTADSNGDGYLTGTELGLFMSDEMANYTEASQTPRYGKLRDPDYDQGDFVFALPSILQQRPDATSAGASSEQPTAIADAMAEMALWTTVAVSQDPAIVRIYLDSYPTGRFAQAAVARIAELQHQIDERTAAGSATAAQADDPTRQSETDPVPATSSVSTGSSHWEAFGEIKVGSLDTIAAVVNGPSNPSYFQIGQPMLVKSLMTYHWNAARGKNAPGTVALKDENGTLVGQWRAEGRPGQGGVPNAYWHVFPELVLQPGRYQVLDSDPKSWSTNTEVGNRGIFRIELQEVRLVEDAPMADVGIN